MGGGVQVNLVFRDSDGTVVGSYFHHSSKGERESIVVSKFSKVEVVVVVVVVDGGSLSN